MPPELDVNEEDIASSEMSAPDVASSKDDATASSSDATGVSEADDLLSVVRNVVDESRQDASAASPAGGQEDGQQPDDSAPKEPDNENFSDVPFGKHPRFKQLIEQRNSFRADATRYRNVQTFLDNNGLGAEEAADALVVAGLLKTNPTEAWNRLKPIVQSLLQVTGEVLPQDLAQRVQSGEMSHEAALEVSRARASVESQRRYQTFEQQRGERLRVQEHTQACVGAAEAWETDRRTKDPNFEAKQPLLMKELTWLQSQEGRPNTPDGVRDQLKRAYEAVNAAYAPPVQHQRTQPRPAVRPVTGGQVAGNAQAKPESTLDIIRANRRRG